MKATNTISPVHYQKVVNCQYACPAQTPVPEYIRLISEKRYTEAYLLNWHSNLFPGVLGRVCDRPCESACRRARLEESPVAICRLKRVAADHKQEIKSFLPQVPEQKNGKRVALIGAGPAALSAARDLVLIGYHVVIFDREQKAGGMMRSQIPNFRLPDSTLDEEVNFVLDMGIETRFSHNIDSMRALLSENFDAIFVATGAPNGRQLELPGLKSVKQEVQLGLNWLANVNFGHVTEVSPRVVVLGGGNTAMDCCRTALRCGAKNVKAIVRSSFETMKSSEWEKQDALKEGIEILNHHVPKRYVFKERKFIGVEFETVTSVYKKGQRTLVPTGDKPVLIECDQVLVAIGQDVSFPWIERDLGIEFDKWDQPELDKKSLQSTLPNVFFGGDAAFGPENIITAVAHGRTAARSIDLFCQQLPLDEYPVQAHSMTSQKMGVHEWRYQNQVSNEQRQLVPHLSDKKALRDLNTEIELGFDEQLAITESLRCLSCDVQTVFNAQRCISCNACEDICPIDCINFIDNDNEETLRKNLRVPATNCNQELYVSDELSTHQVMVKDENLCLHCGLCAERCPTGAWDMQKFVINIK